MDGLLVVDKPGGPTSHDVVARVRRLLKESRVGHTGTLDPMASGVLPLLVGKATRLARFMTEHEKRYDAIVRFGFATDTYDALGVPVGDIWKGAPPARDGIEQALHLFRGTFLQQPPAYSAKKIEGERSYALARRAKRSVAAARPDDAASEGASDAPLVTAPPPKLPSPAEVTAFSLRLTALDGDRATIEIACSSGFYVRSLAHDLGQRLGVGAHLAVLRRTATSGVTLSDAVSLEELAASGPERLIPLDRLLTDIGAVVLTGGGVLRVRQGQLLRPQDALEGFPTNATAPGPFRLTDQTGHLLGMAAPAEAPGLLHGVVVLM